MLLSKLQTSLNTIQKQYTRYCKEKEIEETVQGFSEYLINRNLIKDLIIRMFLVVENYEKAFQDNLEIKHLAVWALEDVVGLKETRIKTILKHNREDFRLRNRLIPKK